MLRGPASVPTILTVAIASHILIAGEYDWPHWRGPNRNGIVAEDSGWDAGGWPSKRPIWETNVGIGSTSPIVVDGRVYVMGWSGDRDTLFCLDADSGRTSWKTSYPAPKYGRHATGDQGLYAGIISTPEYDGETGLLYTLGIDGQLNCWNAERGGAKVWAANLYDKYGVPRREKINRSSRRDYGYTTSPLVYGDWLVVEVGARDGNLLAFDKRSGRQVWASQSKDSAGHTGGPVPIVVEGVPCVAVLTHHHLLVARLDKGKEGTTVAEYPWATEFAQNIATPAVWRNYVLITSGYNHHSICQLEITLRGARKVWEQPQCSQVCSPIIHNGHVYWVYKKPICLDLKTGRTVWTGTSDCGAAGSCIVTADSRLIFWAKRGELVLAETADRSPRQYRELARVGGLFRTEVWPHVVLSDSRILCKDQHGNLKCFRVGSLATTESPPLARVQPDSAPHPRSDAGTASNTSNPTPTSKARPSVSASDLKSWPGNTPGLVIAWRRDYGPDKIVSNIANSSDRWSLKTRGDARFVGRGEAELAGGAVLVEGANETLLAACKQSGELSIEAVLLAAEGKQSGPARIISFSSDPYRRNFTLGQEADDLILRLRTPRTGDNGTNPETKLFSIPAGTAAHVIVSYRNGQLAAYRDGRRVKTSSAVRGDLSNWTLQHLLFGDEYREARCWSGLIERVAIHSRFIADDEARRRFELIRARI